MSEGPAETEVKQTEPKRFSPEVKEALKREGYIIYELRGQSIRSLRKVGKKAGIPLWSNWSVYPSDFQTRSSRRSEVAINPANFFLPGSDNKTLEQQKSLVSELSKELGKRVKGVEAVLGEVADYVDLFYIHLKQTGEQLFGEAYGYKETRTLTPIFGPFASAFVGYFHPPKSDLTPDLEHGVLIEDIGPTAVHDRLCAAPLVVPT